MKTVIDSEKGEVSVISGGKTSTYSLTSAEGFSAVSKAWLRAGWDAKYVYSFTWLGRPIIQLPEDMFRLQEVIYLTKPDVIVETGIAHGGSLIFYASLMEAMGKGRVIGVDIDIRAHNREAIEKHRLFPRISLVQGSSIDPVVISQVHSMICPGETVMVFLDSLHTKDHVLRELRAYSPLVSSGSYVVVMDGIMRDVAGAPRSQEDWLWNNPAEAIKEFTIEDTSFEVLEPPFQFNEGAVADRVTYWPGAFLRRGAQS